MSPHRRATSRHYKLSNDILFLILSHLDPPSMYKVCQAFKRVFDLVTKHTPLLYILELASTGMKDGPVFHPYVSPIKRLQVLRSYNKDWPKIQWIHEFKQLIPSHARVGVSSGFLHQICAHSTQYKFDLLELPSMRTGRTPAQTRHLKFNTSEIENVAIDRGQSLIVASHLIRAQNGISVVLYFRDLWTFHKHPRAHTGLFDFGAGSTPVANMSMSICGQKLSVSFEFAGGKMKHMILNWRNPQKAWLEDDDIHFLGENRLLTFKRSHTRPLLAMYNIADLDRIVLEHEYELPDEWGSSIIGFSPNTSPTDHSCSPEALFFSDPSARLLLMVVRLMSKQEAIRLWLIIDEAYFSSAVCMGYQRVPWSHWNQYCLVRNVPPMVQDPHIVGRKMVFLDAIPGSSRNVSRLSNYCYRLNVIHFAPFPNPEICHPNRVWSWIGQRSNLVPTEFSREVPGNTTDGRKLEHIRVTEDNIVLFLENRDGGRPVNVLTFGAVQDSCPL